MSKKSIVQTIINRNVERQLVREFLMKNTKKSGFGGLEIRRTPAGTDVTVHAERPGMVIGPQRKDHQRSTKPLESRVRTLQP